MTYETTRQDRPVCPHCGYKHDDAWEWNFGLGLDGDTSVRCYHCDELFDCERVIDVSYTTKPTHAALDALKRQDVDIATPKTSTCVGIVAGGEAVSART